MVKYATALRLGTAETEAILRRLTRNNLQHPTYRALTELGKAVRTVLSYVNTLMIQQVLGEDRWANAMSPDDLRSLSPLLCSHVNPYGVFNLDLSTRLPIDEAA
jgi:TnpA family transposase